MKNGMRIIGLTGGIGSGKSTVSGYISKKGFSVLDADKIAREIVAPGSPVLSRLVSAFGNDILDQDGALDRKKLAGIVFSDLVLREKMDEIMHGDVLRIMKERIEKHFKDGYNSLIFLDIPLLFESKARFLEEIDETWLVDAPFEKRVERIVKRDGCTREEILDRMKNQMGSAEKKAMADIVIDNSGNEEDLYHTVDKLIKTYVP